MPTYTDLDANDHTVMCCLRRGLTDPWRITRHTTLSKREVRTCFRNLEAQDLILVIPLPAAGVTVLTAGLTRAGLDYFEWVLTTGGEHFND